MCNEIVFRFFIGCKHGKNQFEVQLGNLIVILMTHISCSLEKWNVPNYTKKKIKKTPKIKKIIIINTSHYAVNK